MATLSENDRVRYARNLLIPGIGEAGQERLQAARVLVVGLGGLGSPVAYYLAAAGVGTVGLLDSDAVELSNLQRQILHATRRIGQAKTASAAAALGDLNPGVALRQHAERLTAASAEVRLEEYDFVVEACDTFEAQFLINDACLALRKPFVTAGVVALSGQALFVVPGKTPCLRCVLADVPEGVPCTADSGVLGATAGVLGCIEALEALRYIAGLWEPPEDGCGRLHRLDGDAMQLTTLRVPRRHDCRCANLWSEP